MWGRLFQALGEEDLEAELAEVHLDSSSVKAHPVASTGRRRGGKKKEEADERRCLGRSRGVLTTKVHALTGRNGRLFAFTLTAGQRGDPPQAEPLLESFEPGRIGTLVADAAYDSDAVRERGKQLRARVCIKPNPTRKQKKRFDKKVYKRRNRIERFFRRVKQCRRIATRCEKKPENYAGFLWLAAIVTDLN